MTHDNKEAFANHFDCKDCPGGPITLLDVKRTMTGICEIEVVCERCKDWYVVRYDPEKPEKYIICNRKVLIFGGQKSRRYRTATTEALTMKRAELRAALAKS